MWRDAHPDLALALLSADEADALAAVAQRGPNDENVEINYPFDKPFNIVSSHGFTIGIRVRLLL